MTKKAFFNIITDSVIWKRRFVLLYTLLLTVGLLGGFNMAGYAKQNIALPYQTCQAINKN